MCHLATRYPELRCYDGPNGPVTRLVQWSCPEHMEAVLRAGIHPDAGQGGVFGTLLQEAACHGDIARLKLLLGFGASTEVRNDDGETPLAYAVGWQQREAVEVLLDAGAQINAIEDDGAGRRSTALDATNDPELIAYLRSQGALTLAELEPEI